MSTDQRAGEAEGSPEGDWATQVVDHIDDFVGKIRSATTDRLQAALKAVVYGALAAIVGAMAAIVAVVMAVRILDIVIPQGVWLTYLILGGVFCAAGVFCWSKRS